MASRAAPPPPPSHAAFLLGQVRSSWAHLYTTQAIDAKTYQQVQDVLTGIVLDERQSDGSRTRAMTGDVEGETEEERLGRRNAWLRETLTETSLLPTLVSTAMSIAIPSALLGSMQREAIEQLVERSQRSIAEAVTNPKLQRRAGSGAVTGVKGTGLGVRRGFQAAGQSIQELSTKRQEARKRSEEKEARKKEKRALKKELKMEREAIIRRRQAEILAEGGDDGQGSGAASDRPLPTTTSTDDAHSTTANADRRMGSRDMVQSPTMLTTNSSTSASLMHRLPPPAPSGTSAPGGEQSDSDDSDSSDDDDEDEVKTFAEDGALASVTCGRVDDDQDCVTATTTFSPWPGLILSSTLVALSDDKLPAAASIDRVRLLQSVPEQPDPAGPPPRRLAPVPASAQHTAPSAMEGVRGSDVISPSPSTTASAPPPRAVAPPPPPPAKQQDHSTPYTQPPPGPTRTNPTAPPFMQANARTAQAPSTAPSIPHSGPPPTRTEVRDVTELKQKSWTKKLGL